jgi:uncharacterized membrane protein
MSICELFLAAFLIWIFIKFLPLVFKLGYMSFCVCTGHIKREEHRKMLGRFRSVGVPMSTFANAEQNKNRPST